MDGMGPSFALRRLARRMAVLLLCAGALVYFGGHALYGDHGIHAYLRLSDRVVALAGEKAALHAERERLEHRARLLRPESLDPDMLDEQARGVLGFGGPDEVIVLKPE
jgi:cell division protein FtsB